MSNILIPITGFDNYQVDLKGQIHGPSGKILKGGKDKDGYILVTLRKDGKNFTRKAHRLVCEAIWLQKPGRTDVNHKDGNKANNHPDNLEWVTPSQNRIHAYDIGLQPKGENHGRAKIPNEAVEFIRNNLIPRHPEFGGAALGRKFGLSRSQVNRIFNGKFR